MISETSNQENFAICLIPSPCVYSIVRFYESALTPKIDYLLQGNFCLGCAVTHNPMLCTIVDCNLETLGMKLLTFPLNVT